MSLTAEYFFSVIASFSPQKLNECCSTNFVLLMWTFNFLINFDLSSQFALRELVTCFTEQTISCSSSTAFLVRN